MTHFVFAAHLLANLWLRTMGECPSLGPLYSKIMGPWSLGHSMTSPRVLQAAALKLGQSVTSPRARGVRPCRGPVKGRSARANKTCLMCHGWFLQQLHLALCFASESWKPRHGRCDVRWNCSRICFSAGRGFGPAAPPPKKHMEP